MKTSRPELSSIEIRRGRCESLENNAAHSEGEARAGGVLSTQRLPCVYNQAHASAMESTISTRSPKGKNQHWWRKQSERNDQSVTFFPPELISTGTRPTLYSRLLPGGEGILLTPIS